MGIYRYMEYTAFAIFHGAQITHETLGFHRDALSPPNGWAYSTEFVEISSGSQSQCLGTFQSFSKGVTGPKIYIL